HRISALFPRQADISAKTFFRAGAFVACLHDATASSGDDHESRLGYFPAKLNSLLILDPGGLRAGGTKNCYLAELRVGSEELESVAQFPERSLNHPHIPAIFDVGEEFQ